MIDSCTPTFAMQAAQSLAAGDAREAVELCANGIRHFPDYATGYIVLAEAYELLGMTSDALLIRNAARERFLVLARHTANRLPVSNETHSEETPAAAVQATESHDTPGEHVALETVDAEVPQQATDTEQATPTLVGEARLLAMDVGLEPPAFQQSSVQATPPASASHSMHPLRLVAAREPVEGRVIRASSVRLIPGLEYTSLRFEGTKTRGRRMIQHLLDPPTFRTFHAPMRANKVSHGVSNVPEPSGKKRLSLEDLAKRLERARMPRPTELAKAPPPEPVLVHIGSSLVTETIANIYFSQGALEKALDAFRQLQARHPDQHEAYAAKINDVLKRMAE